MKNKKKFSLIWIKLEKKASFYLLTQRFFLGCLNLACLICDLNFSWFFGAKLKIFYSRPLQWPDSLRHQTLELFIKYVLIVLGTRKIKSPTKSNILKSPRKKILETSRYPRWFLPMEKTWKILVTCNIQKFRRHFLKH